MIVTAIPKRVAVVEDDSTRQAVDAIVNAANTSLPGSHQFSAAGISNNSAMTS